MLLDLIFPKQCLSCYKWGQYICNNCSKALTINNSQRCIVCQKPSLYGYTHSRCRTKTSPDRLITIFKYSDGLISKSINSAKLSLIPSLFYELTEKSLEYVEFKHQLHRFTLCSIPIHINKRLYRGFNQSEIISKVLSLKLKIPVDNFLSKNKITKQQKALKKEARQINLQSSFTIRDKKSLPKFVILTDDVTTSGATFIEACKTAKEAGVSIVWCFALAQD